VHSRGSLKPEYDLAPKWAVRETAGTQSKFRVFGMREMQISDGYFLLQKQWSVFVYKFTVFDGCESTENLNIRKKGVVLN
jgi:hypothetical protein